VPGNASAPDRARLLDALVKSEKVTAESLKELVLNLDSYDVLAKVFLLEGVPFVFEQSPMKYMIFREQVAGRFDVGSQDVCIVGSAKLGFSPAAEKYGRPFANESDVDVVVISERMFDLGTQSLFQVLERTGPSLSEFGYDAADARGAKVERNDWRVVKEGIRNYVYQNFNPGLLPDHHPLRVDIFQKIKSTAPLFMALEPKVFVSKIRCRFFRNWRAAEGYYTNTLRQLARKFKNEPVDVDDELADIAEVVETRVTMG
jgi:hypothetical protein